MLSKDKLVYVYTNRILRDTRMKKGIKLWLGLKNVG